MQQRQGVADEMDDGEEAAEEEEQWDLRRSGKLPFWRGSSQDWDD